MEERVKKFLEEVYKETGVLIHNVGVTWWDMSTVEGRDFQISCVNLTTAKNTDIK